ncbi:MAG TPA: hypothetical protein VH682_22180, partial [Gemmataceae bacterium]
PTATCPLIHFASQKDILQANAFDCLVTNHGVMISHQSCSSYSDAASYGADPHHRNNANLTPLDIPKRKRDDALLRFLESK